VLLVNARLPTAEPALGAHLCETFYCFLHVSILAETAVQVRRGLERTNVMLAKAGCRLKETGRLEDTMEATPELREFLFRYDATAPLELHTREPELLANGIIRERLSYASINLARVPAVLTYEPATPEPRPVLIIQHGLHSSKDDPRLGNLAAAWAPFGFACITIDAPLHGERAQGEFDLRALLSLPYAGLRFVVQNVVDLRRTVDYIETRADLAAGRIAFVGFSMSTFLGVPFVALEPRVRAACLALGGAGLFHFLASQSAADRRADQELIAKLVDPLHYAADIAPRPVLQVNSEIDEIVPAALGHMLYSSLGEPKRSLWYRGAHGELPAEVIAEMRLFLSDALDEGGVIPRTFAVPDSSGSLSHSRADAPRGGVER